MAREKLELTSMTVAEKQVLLLEKTEDLFRYRMQHTTGQLGQPHLLKQTRREIAQIMTSINQETKDGTAAKSK